MATYQQLVISRIPGLTVSERMKVDAVLPGPEALLQLRKKGLEELIGRALRSRKYDPVQILREAEQTAAWLGRNQSRAVCLTDADYPVLLREIYDPPFVLYWKGVLPPLSVPAISIVGTRHATGTAEQAAFRMGFEAGWIRVPVVSGLAAGVDFSAHTGAVCAGGGTWGILGSGLDHIYPSSSRILVESILSRGGGILTEYIPHEPPLKWNFPPRNRIISGFSRSVCIVEAPERSGALITAEYALEQGRDLFVHTSGLQHRRATGTKKLADEGAPLLSSMKDVCADWGWNSALIPNLEAVRGDSVHSEKCRLLKSGSMKNKVCRFQNICYRIHAAADCE